MTLPQHITKTRLAPTPSGFLHLGNALSFAITAGLAAKYNAAIFLRIDDLDRDRIEEAYVQDIFETLEFLGIPWQQGPRNYQEYQAKYSQLHRMEHYNNALHQLENSGAVFACECSRAQVPNGIYPGTCRHKNIPLNSKNVNWRLHTCATKTMTVHTLDGEKISTTLPPEMQDFVVRKKDGFPAYQLASLADDHLFGINLVVRGEDLWASTLAQLYLAGVLNYHDFSRAVFYHHPLLLESGDRKMSKSAGATSIQHLRQQGKQRPDIYQMIADMIGIKTPVHDFVCLSNVIAGK